VDIKAVYLLNACVFRINDYLTYYICNFATMIYLENIKLAIISLKSNLLRSTLTILIIMVGITALVGILTAIDTILFSLNDNFSSIGSNSFTVRPAFQNIRSSNQGARNRTGDVIDFRQATRFKDRYNFPGAKVSVFTNYQSEVTARYKAVSTNPVINIMGIDENYLNISGLNIGKGRYFNHTELQEGFHLVVLGNGLYKSLFKDKKTNAIGEIVVLNGYNYKVIGVLEEEAQSRNNNNNQTAFVPLINGKRYYHHEGKAYNINVSLENSIQMDEAISSAIAVFRNVRGLKTRDSNDFEITKSDNLLNMLMDATFKIRFATIAIAVITLFGAAIGLMNIMLVTVAERTREVGIRKALGATNKHILTQFLSESVIISQAGGILGILLGILIGIALATYIKGTFVMPWLWIMLALFLNTVVGLLSGVFPAMKAAELDPIESLRYE
jgi:putative ABC transport system permease protein